MPRDRKGGADLGLDLHYPLLLSCDVILQAGDLLVDFLFTGLREQHQVLQVARHNPLPQHSRGIWWATTTKGSKGVNLTFWSSTFSLSAAIVSCMACQVRRATVTSWLITWRGMRGILAQVAWVVP